MNYSVIKNDYLWTRPDASPPVSLSTSSMDTMLKSPSMECFRQEAATANRLGIISVQACADQAAAEAVAAAYAVNDVHGVLFAEEVIASVVEHCGPFVVVCGDGLAQGDGNFGESETVCQLFCHIFIAFMVYFAFCNVRIGSLDAEYVGCILPVKWNHSAPSKISFQLKSDADAVAMDDPARS